MDEAGSEGMGKGDAGRHERANAAHTNRLGGGSTARKQTRRATADGGGGGGESGDAKTHADAGEGVVGASEAEGTSDRDMGRVNHKQQRVTRVTSHARDMSKGRERKRRTHSRHRYTNKSQRR